MPLKSTVKVSVETKLQEYEGRYNHMYLDTKGKVTIGVGHLIPNKSAVATLSLFTVKNNIAFTPATLKEKQEEYDTIAKQVKNYKAGWYKKHCKLVMKDADINIQLKKHIKVFYKELSSLYNKANGYAIEFDSMPEEVQIALFDMIFNLGLIKLRTTFSKFNKAIKQKDWMKQRSKAPALM